MINMYNVDIFYAQFVFILKTFKKNQTLKIIKSLRYIIKNDFNIIECFIIARETKIKINNRK